MNSKRIFFFILGGLLAIFSSYYIAETYLFTASAVEVSAKVSEVYYQPGTAQRYVKVIYNYGNEVKEYKFPIGKNHSYRYPLGSMVKLLYSAEDQQDIRLNSFWSLWGLKLVFLLAGILICLLPVIKRY